MGPGGWTGDMALSTRLSTVIHRADLEAPEDEDLLDWELSHGHGFAIWKIKNDTATAVADSDYMDTSEKITLRELFKASAGLDTVSLLRRVLGNWASSPLKMKLTTLSHCRSLKLTMLYLSQSVLALIVLPMLHLSQSVFESVKLTMSNGYSGGGGGSSMLSRCSCHMRPNVR